MEIIITRTKFTDQYTEGEMTLNGDPFCSTLEDTVRSDGIKIQGETAIPFGRYRLIMSYSQRFQRVMPQLINVPNFEGIRIHPGNTDKDTSGCVLVGKPASPGVLKNSRDIYNLLVYELTIDKTDHWVTIK